VNIVRLYRDNNTGEIGSMLFTTQNKGTACLSLAQMVEMNEYVLKYEVDFAKV
jgi:hypothetical protein